MQKEVPNISIIIPVLNEEDYIQRVLAKILENTRLDQVMEILVVDGGSTDQTVFFAQKFGARVISSEKGRAKQMNWGAKNASGDILYFLHVDSLPPPGFDTQVLKVFKEGKRAGCFRLKFDSPSPFLGFFAWCTKINRPICRGGDQSLFVKKELFETLGGFDENYKVYEDNEFIGRLYKKTPFKVINDYVETSARRYMEKGMVRLQYHFAMIHLKYYLGKGPENIYDYYRKNIAL
ncbi:MULTISPECIES: TIGR04283 family arsenosugar biosynthesis glycosyltransferase [Maribacter]|uniref:TIGR04283 family arsenosugar biosynthesis glycosyltransferase n=1 Tax=Maribacter flavus TaxID=1658664 RepID=A0ABU7IFS3_9FLAO|nr:MULTISPECIES: TIGR04283 family arsenosugar biosynthesis glycosyltransferase [Maribacter]MDC6405398.1 TIGR04283 family arsenosugar biosynthesis glycosyltransferase [Maribacter sp. PR66]MEE1971794.1 TIGR04283 family arsenosugar biosynthesis glycosyltransferase [Maribacter flavus]